MAVFWESAQAELTPTAVAERLMQQNAAHHFIAFLVVLVVMVTFAAGSRWLALVRRLLTAVGLMREQGLELEVRLGIHV